MNFSNYPRDYQSIFQPATIGIYDCDPEQAVDVELVENHLGNTLGLKRFKGASYYSFDASGCLRHIIDPYPVGTYQQPMLYAQPMHTLRLMARMEIFQTPEILLTAARERVAPETLLTAAPAEKRIHAGGFDEWSVIVRERNLYAILRLTGPNGAEARIDSHSLRVDHDMATLAFSLPALAANIEPFDRLEATLYADDRPIAVQRYLIEKARDQAVALSWLNAHGAIDCYTLFTRQKEEAAIKRSTIRDAFGEHKPGGIEADTLITLLSDYEPRVALDYLLGIATAPLVWTLDAQLYRQIEVVKADIVGQPDQPARLRIVYRPCQPIVYQNLR